MSSTQGTAGPQHSLFDTILAAFVPVHREGWPFVAIAIGAALIAFLIWSPLGWALAALAAAIAYFFRDPVRVTPVRDGLVVSPADGVVSGIDLVPAPVELGLGPEPRRRISIFLSVLDVHVNRSPVGGAITRSIYTPGQFLNAAAPAASGQNERRSLVIETASGEALIVVQIAGMIARRIVTTVSQGDTVAPGERIGLIRFGSRVDVYLPADRSALVAVGQYMIGGETVLADLASQEAARAVKAS